MDTGVVTYKTRMIMVYVMFNYNSTYERYNHDSQTFYKKITDNIAKYVDFKPYV